MEEVAFLVDLIIIDHQVAVAEQAVLVEMQLLQRLEMVGQEQYQILLEHLSLTLVGVEVVWDKMAELLDQVGLVVAVLAEKIHQME
jgi:hypothetical protein